MVHEIWINKNDGRGCRQYMFELNEWAELQKRIMEGLAKGWYMQYIPAGPIKEVSADED